jgi:CubicO group peptidase (beta-lactamase class C family)
MNINLKFKSLITVLLLSGFSSFVAANTEENTKGTENLAPEVSAVEVKLSFRDIPSLKKNFIDSKPADRKDGILVGELGIDGGNKDMIIKLAQEIANNKHDRFDSLLIAHKDKLIFESYYLRGRINLAHPQASATKVYTSLALGRAIELGYLSMADLDKPLVSFLKDLDPIKFVQGVEKITLHQAMTMRSGLRINRDKMKELRKNSSQLKGQGQIQAYLEHSAPITAESQSFLYQGSDPTLVMQVLDAVVPGTANDFIKNELLDKMGIATYRWRTDVSGMLTASFGSSMTSRDMVKWGTLAINKGKWNGEQLIPAAFIARATSKIAKPSDDEVVPAVSVSDTAYGYFWWQADMKVGNESYLSKAARGGGGQYIIVIEELDVVVVVTAHNKSFHDDTSSLTANRILPAFIK